MSSIAVVTPWFGDYCRGGAERFAGILYDLLTQLDHDVDLLTTTSKSFDSKWAVSFYKPGNCLEHGRRIRRFEVASRDAGRFDEVNGKLLGGQMIGNADEHVFLHANINSLSLNHEVAQGGYDLYVYLPYLYGPTLFGLLNVRNRNVIIPLLHDESYARLRLVARSLLLSQAAVFLSPAEQDLFHRLYGRSLPLEAVAPVPIDVGADDEGRTEPELACPYFLYAGRKDGGKNLKFLFETLRCCHNDEVALVLLGGGRIDIPSELNDRVHDLGYVDEARKRLLMKRAVCVVQPSLLESFSIVAAEANALGVPVIVHRASPVLGDYVRRSGGGLAVDGPDAAAAEVDRWSVNMDLAREIGRTGQQFVAKELSWSAVREIYAVLLDQLLRRG